MANQVSNYQCPACTGPLHFSSQTGKLECEYCGSSFSVKEVEDFYKAKDQKAEENFAPEVVDESGNASPEGDSISEEEITAEQTTEEKAQYTGSDWDEGSISSDWGEAKGKLLSYSCPSCGASLITEVTTAATCCPYCGNPTIVPGQFKDTLKPDFVIPFTMDKNAATAALKKHYKGKIFLPSTFSSQNQINKLQGVYVPFWLFDADANADMKFDGRRSHSHRSGDYIITRTEHYDVRRSGAFRFLKVPADASKKMPDSLMDSIEPFDYSALTKFSPAYLPGFLADRYDVTIEQDEERIVRRCGASCTEILRNDVSGYSEVHTKSSQVNVRKGKVHYALLPVWVMTTKWNNKNYLFVMNGQTGKLVGDLPVDKGKFRLFTLGVGLALAALVYLLKISGFIAAMISGLIG